MVFPFRQLKHFYQKIQNFKLFFVEYVYICLNANRHMDKNSMCLKIFRVSFFIPKL